MGRLDRSLKRRVFRRLLVQSSELAIHKGGSPAWALIRIISTQSVDLISAFGALLFRSSPGPKARALLYRSFRAKGLRPAAAATTKATIFAAPGAACDPLVSIIVPTYERADMIPELLRSVADQAYRPVEIVIVDDGSTDNTAAVIQDFVVSLARDAGLFVKYHSGARRGAPAARNKGIALASGQYLMFADSDDAFAGGGIGDLVRHLAAHPAWGYAYGKVLQADSHFVAIAGREFVGSSFRAASGADLAGYHWHTMGALYRRSCVDKVGAWNEDLSGSQDWEYQARMKMFGGGCGLVDTLVGYWRHHDLARVGTKSFRPDYVDSVMKACASILDHARHAGKCDATLEAKIARRLVVHALEWSANGRRGDRNRCLQQARNSLSSNMVLSWVVRMMTYLPQQIDVWLFAILHGAQAKRLPNLRKRS
jgi:glycosyltransferase involved in cell wall biosynthesis